MPLLVWRVVGNIQGTQYHQELAIRPRAECWGTGQASHPGRFKDGAFDDCGVGGVNEKRQGLMRMGAFPNARAQSSLRVRWIFDPRTYRTDLSEVLLHQAYYNTLASRIFGP